MKRIMTFMLTFSLLFANFTTVNAAQSTTTTVFERRQQAQQELNSLVPEEVMEKVKSSNSTLSSYDYKINEYDLAKELSALSEVDLSAAGYDEYTIEVIKNYDEAFENQMAVFLH